jgi:hypothetical protein
LGHGNQRRGGGERGARDSVRWREY